MPKQKNLNILIKYKRSEKRYYLYKKEAMELFKQINTLDPTNTVDIEKYRNDHRRIKSGIEMLLNRTKLFDVE